MRCQRAKLVFLAIVLCAAAIPLYAAENFEAPDVKAVMSGFKAAAAAQPSAAGSPAGKQAKPKDDVLILEVISDFSQDAEAGESWIGWDLFENDYMGQVHLKATASLKDKASGYTAEVSLSGLVPFARWDGFPSEGSMLLVGEDHLTGSAAIYKNGQFVTVALIGLHERSHAVATVTITQPFDPKKPVHEKKPLDPACWRAGDCKGSVLVSISVPQPS